MKKAKWVALTVWALAAAVLAQTQEPQKVEATGPRHEPGREASGEGLILHFIDNAKVVQELGLTEDQVKKIRDGAAETRKAQTKLRGDLELAGVAQAKLLTGEKVDEKALMQAVEKTGQIRTDLAKLQMRQILFIRNNLTPDQHAKLRQMIGRRMEEWAKRSGATSRTSDRGHERRDRRSSGEGQEPPPVTPPPAEPAQP